MMEDRLLARISPEPNSGCWLWTGTHHSNGYGKVTIPSKGQHFAHRVAYQTWVGPITDGLYVLHRCDVRCCVNPQHLFLGTHDDNTKDRHAKGREAKGVKHGTHTKPESRAFGDRSGARTMPHRTPRGERVGTSVLTEDDVRSIRADNRQGTTIARDFGVQSNAIYKIKNGSRWRHVK